MKKLILLTVLAFAVALSTTEVSAQNNQSANNQSTKNNERYTLTFKEQGKTKTLYTLSLSSFDSAFQGKLIERMYKSSVVAVVSRLSAEGDLTVSIYYQTSLDALKQELNHLIELTTNDSSQAPEKF